MRVIIRRSLCSAVFAGGILALGAGAANAADQLNTGTSGVGSAVQTAVAQPAESIPATFLQPSGLQGGVLVDAVDSVQVAVPVTVPVNVSGNAVGVLGQSVANESQASNSVPVPGQQASEQNMGGDAAISKPSKSASSWGGVLGQGVVSGSQASNDGAQAVPMVPAVPVKPTVPVTNVTVASLVTPAIPAALAEQGAHMVTGTESGSVRVASSVLQELRATQPTQLAATGSGLWPVYLSVVVLITGMGLLLALRPSTPRSVVLAVRPPMNQV